MTTALDTTVQEELAPIAEKIARERDKHIQSGMAIGKLLAEEGPPLLREVLIERYAEITAMDALMTGFGFAVGEQHPIESAVRAALQVESLPNLDARLTLTLRLRARWSGVRLLIRRSTLMPKLPGR